MLLVIILFRFSIIGAFEESSILAVPGNVSQAQFSVDGAFISFREMLAVFLRHSVTFSGLGTSPWYLFVADNVSKSSSNVVLG